MFKDGTQGDLNGFLDAGSRMQGDLHFEDTFRVDGKLTGKIVSKGNLVIGKQGSVEADIEIGHIIVSGSVKGAIKATQRIEIAAEGKVFADVDTPSLVIEDGAFFEGRCSMAPSANTRPPS